MRLQYVWPVLLCTAHTVRAQQDECFGANANVCPYPQYCMDVDQYRSNTWQCWCPDGMSGFGEQAQATCLSQMGPSHLDECDVCARSTVNQQDTNVQGTILRRYRNLAKGVCSQQCMLMQDCEVMVYHESFNRYEWGCSPGATCCTLLYNTGYEYREPGAWMHKQEITSEYCHKLTPDDVGQCVAAGQICVDPTAGTYNVADWQCECSADRSISSRRRPAVCPSPAPSPPTPTPITQAPPSTPSPPTPSPPTPPTAKPSGSSSITRPTSRPPTQQPTTIAPATPSPPTTSPETPEPSSDAPSTQSPSTAVPGTPEPATVNPGTIVPETLEPSTFTYQPGTRYPPTSTPPTLSPPTTAPSTSGPETASPPTTIPDTLVPSTAVPSTGAPPTQAPATLPIINFIPTGSPPTLLPQTGAPSTEAPTPATQTQAPQPTPSPPTALPQTLTPSTPQPPTDPPQTDVPTPTPSPPTALPQTLTPSTPQPPTDPPQTDTPAPTPSPSPPTALPQTGAPSTEAPTPATQTQAPQPTALPQTLTPSTPQPPTDPPQTDTPAPTPSPSPPTALPQTGAPSTEAPTPATQTQAPQPTALPQTLTPSTPQPPTDPPQTDAPTPTPTSAPDTALPGSLTLIPVVTTRVPGSSTAVSRPTAQPPPSATGMPPLLTAEPPATVRPYASRAPVSRGGGGGGVGATEAPRARGLRDAALDAVNAAQVVQTGATATAAIAAVTASSTPTMRLIAIATMCEPHMPFQTKRYSLAMSPTQLELMGSPAFGAIIGNVAIALFAVGAGWALASLLSHCAGKCFDRLDIHAALMFPSAPLVVFQLLYQGTSLAGMDLVINDARAELLAVGIVGIGLCLFVPLLIHRRVAAGVPAEAYVRDSLDDRGCGSTFLYNGGEWVSRTRAAHFARRWGPVLRPFRCETAWYAVVEFAASFLISAAQAVNPTTLRGCGHVKLCTALIFAVLLGMEARIWPHLHRRNSMFDVMLLGGQMAAMIVLALAYYSGRMESGLYVLAAYLLVYCLIVVVVRTIIDVVAVVVSVARGRGRRLQEEAFLAEEAKERGKEGAEMTLRWRKDSDETSGDDDEPLLRVLGLDSTMSPKLEARGMEQEAMLSRTQPSLVARRHGTPVLSFSEAPQRCSGSPELLGRSVQQLLSPSEASPSLSPRGSSSLRVSSLLLAETSLPSPSGGRRRRGMGSLARTPKHAPTPVLGDLPAPMDPLTASKGSFTRDPLLAPTEVGDVASLYDASDASLGASRMGCTTPLPRGDGSASLRVWGRRGMRPRPATLVVDSMTSPSNASTGAYGGCLLDSFVMNADAASVSPRSMPNTPHHLAATTPRRILSVHGTVSLSSQKLGKATSMPKNTSTASLMPSPRIAVRAPSPPQMCEI